MKNLLLILSLVTLPLFAGLEEGNEMAKKGDYPHALEALNQAIVKSPNNPRAYKIRGHIYYAMGDYQKSLEDLNHVVELTPKNPTSYTDRAIVHSVLHHHSQALSDVEIALKLNPDSHYATEVRKKILENAAAK